MKYLYGLSIQGIQSYIFSTDKLKEIIGASQLVAKLPRQIIEEIIGGNLNDDNIIIDAAGNFKYLFDDKQQCDLVFKSIPIRFYQLAGNLTVSQAIVETENLSATQIDELEILLKIQRNRPFVFPNLASMAIKKNPKTGKPVVDREEKDWLDKEQVFKRQANKSYDTIAPFDSENKMTEDIENMTSDKYENWIAVIHADGNGLGQKIIQMSDRVKDNGEDVKTTFKEFSKNLQQATESAVKRAFDEVVSKNCNSVKLPFRPIIIGGDDVTVITRGDLALDFTERFLEYFEEETKIHLKDFTGGLTACAGIAYTKSHYPFHYGVDLAEELCKESKKISKEIDKKNAPSSLMFHKMYSSFVRNWEKIKDTELKAGEVSFVSGPYFITEQKGYYSVAQIRKYAKLLSEKEAPKSNIRTWLSELGKDETRAKDLIRRTKEMLSRSQKERYWNGLDLESQISPSSKTHLYDALVIEDFISKNK